MNPCDVCGNAMQTGWIACPFCGVQIDNVFNSSMSLVEIAENRCQGACSGTCSSTKNKKEKKKKAKSKCCKKHERKKKPCKKCPEMPKHVDGSVPMFGSVQSPAGVSFATNVCRR